MIKISDLKKIKKNCFDKIAKEALQKDGLAVSVKPLGLELIQVMMSNGNDYARVVLDNYKTSVVPEICLNWKDFLKVCELFQKEITITKKDNRIKISEDKTNLTCTEFAHTFNSACDFKFDFKEALLLETEDLFILDSHLPMNGFAITQDKLLSCDGCICIVNNLSENFGDNILQYPDKFPDDDWYIGKNSQSIVSKDKRTLATKRLLEGTYPANTLLILSKQFLGNSFTCNAKELEEKFKQCSLIFDKMELGFGKDELTIQSEGSSQNKFKTSIPVKYTQKTTRKSIKFMVKYISMFCKCVDKDGNVKIFFDDNEAQHMLKAECDKYTIFAMGIGPV